MKISELTDDVNIADLENFFDIYEDEKDPMRRYFFNLNSTICFDGVPNKFKSISHDQFWNTISYEIYGTTRLWWLLMKLNNVGPQGLFEPVRAGSAVKYVDKDVVGTIMGNLGGWAK